MVLEALPLKSALAGRNYGSVANVSRKKQLTLRLRLRSVLVSAASAILFATLIGVCLSQIFTNELQLTPVHQIENIEAGASDHLIHLYHVDRKDDTNYQGDCTTVEHDAKVGVKECFSKCKADRGCKSFTFDIKSKKCCGSTSYEPGYTVAGHTNWYQMQVFGPECKLLQVLSNTMRKANKVPDGWSDVSNSLKGCARVKTLEECIGKCVTSESCKAFNYARSGGMCCGSTSAEQGVLGMGVDFLILPQNAGKAYNPEQDCYHQVKEDVTAGGTASINDLFSGKGSAATPPSSSDAAASVQGVVTRVADSAKDAAKDAGSLNEFMKELFPEKFGLKVGASSVNVGEVKAAPAMPMAGMIQSSALRAPQVAAPAYGAAAAAAPSSAGAGAASLAAPTRHVHGAPLPAGTRPFFVPPAPASSLPALRANPVALSSSMSSPPVPMINGAVRSSSIPLVPSFGHETSSQSQPMNDLSTQFQGMDYLSSTVPAAALPFMAIPGDPEDALAQAQLILIMAEKRAAELIASAS